MKVKNAGLSWSVPGEYEHLHNLGTSGLRRPSTLNSALVQLGEFGPFDMSKASLFCFNVQSSGGLVAANRKSKKGFGAKTCSHFHQGESVLFNWF